MVKKRALSKHIKNIALRFGNILEEEGILIKKLIIFGSYAKAKADKESDIDLCIVSPNFGKNPLDELQFLLKQTRKVDTRIEPIPASPQEYREAISPLIYEIKKYGREIYSR